MAPKRIVHIGAGPWSQNYIKTYREFPITVSLATRDSWQSLVEERPDGVVICTPPQTHIEMAKFALERAIPVLIEKPLALSLAEAKELSSYTAPVMVDHLYLFSPRYQALKREITGHEIRHIETTGTGTKSHTDHSILWDYGPHDIAMVLDLMGRLPESVSAHETATSEGLSYDLTLNFGAVVTESHFGLAAERSRSVLVRYDATEGLFTDTGTDVPGPLYYAVEAFLAVIEGTPDPRQGLELSFRVLRILEAAERSCSLGMAVNLA